MITGSRTLSMTSTKADPFERIDALEVDGRDIGLRFTVRIASKKVTSWCWAVGVPGGFENRLDALAALREHEAQMEDAFA